MTSPLAEHWVHVCSQSARTSIIPDGCRDVVLVSRCDRSPEWHWFDLADRVVEVELEAGITLNGFRFLPGTRFSHPGLATELTRTVHDPEAMAALLSGEARRSTRIDEALAALARGRGRVADHARDLGVGERRLHRLIVAETGRPPVFWLRLARMRHAARLLTGGATSAAEVAAACGFSDQAHLCREAGHWFARTPSEIAGSAEIGRQLAAPAWA